MLVNNIQLKLSYNLLDCVKISDGYSQVPACPQIKKYQMYDTMVMCEHELISH